MTEPPANLRPTCLKDATCPRARWEREPWGWICRVCHPNPSIERAAKAVCARKPAVPA